MVCEAEDAKNYKLFAEKCEAAGIGEILGGIKKQEKTPPKTTAPAAVHSFAEAFADFGTNNANVRSERNRGKKMYFSEDGVSTFVVHDDITGNGELGSGVTISMTSGVVSGTTSGVTRGVTSGETSGETSSVMSGVMSGSLIFNGEKPCCIGDRDKGMNYFFAISMVGGCSAVCICIVASLNT